MATLGDSLKPSEKDDFDDATTASPTPMERSKTNSLHSKPSSSSVDAPPSLSGATKEQPQDGGPLEPVPSSQYPSLAKLIPILLAVMLSIVSPNRTAHL